LVYSEVRKAKGNYLSVSENILNFCSNLPSHTLSDIKHCWSEHPDSQHANLNVRKKRLRLNFGND